MTETNTQNLNAKQAKDLIHNLAQAARRAQTHLSMASHDVRNAVLLYVAGLIRTHQDAIHNANAQDVAAAQKNGLTEAFIDRLTLNQARIEAMAAGLEDIARLDDPLGVELARWERPNGLDIARVTTSFGVIGMIYESRPNVTIDAAGLCIKSGNACLLRAGSDAYHTCAYLTELMREGVSHAGLEPACVQSMPTTDRLAVQAMLEAVGLIDVIIPRGGKNLVSLIQAQARVPVFAHLSGICHLYVSAHADKEKAVAICVNAKMRRVGICGAAETILIDKAALNTHGPPIVKALIEAGCEVRGDKDICTLDTRVIKAQAEDWGHEFLSPIIAIAAAEGLEQAIHHIRQYGSGHTESIVSENIAEQNRFFAAIDSAIVMANASTQFADGGEFGMGAEIGIATGKLHARGPIGANQLTSFKYVVRGHGQIRT